MSDAANQWTKFYTENADMMYPAEAVIRIFKGSYPKLTMPKPEPGDNDLILDMGCGDGRHFPLFQSLGMRIAGSEITAAITAPLANRWPDVDMRVCACADMPWRARSFDYLLAWNSCYYMEPGGKFEDHVAEMARVTKPEGWLVCSVPKTSCFIFKDCVFGADGYVTIANDHFGLRNGECMRWFEDADDLQAAFEPAFTNFSHASIDIDMFGLAYNWHVFTAERR